MTKQRLGKRNPLQLFEESDKNRTDSFNSDSFSRIETQNSLAVSTFMNPESVIETQDSPKQKPEKEDPLFSLSVRIKESLNDALDDAVKITRRNRGRKIRKEIMVAIAVEAMMAQVEEQGGWTKIDSEEDLRKFLGIHNHDS